MLLGHGVTCNFRLEEAPSHPMTDIARRKADHIDLAARGEVGFRDKTTLFECVQLVHNALPELDYDAIDTSVELFGKRLRAPLLIAAMTGGTERAARINADLARIAEIKGYAFGLGSQRAMFEHPELVASFLVRSAAPSALVLGNLGAVQASRMSTAQVEGLLTQVHADALCLHLNPAMEIIQADGDRDFRGVLGTLERLVDELPFPVIAKETGCGLSHEAGERLHAVGVRHVDVSGAGGTSWVGVEAERAEAEPRALGELFWDWGIPTAASVAQMAPLGFDTIFATGGIAHGIQVAKAIALGAKVAGIARPVLQAHATGGIAGATQLLERIEKELRVTMLLVGAKDLSALADTRWISSEPLRSWLAPEGV